MFFSEKKINDILNDNDYYNLIYTKKVIKNNKSTEKKAHTFTFIMEKL